MIYKAPTSIKNQGALGVGGYSYYVHFRRGEIENWVMNESL